MQPDKCGFISFCMCNSGIEQLSALTCLTELDLSIPGPIAESLVASSSLELNWINDTGLQYLIHLKRVSSLTLKYTMVSCSFIHHKLPQLLHLKKLSLSHCSNVNDSTCFHLKGCKSLTMLDISFCHISDMGIKGLATTAPNLKELDLTGSLGSISCRGLRSLHTLQMLLWLSLAHCEHITDEGLEELGYSARALEYLSLKGCAQITNKGIESIRKELDRLKELVLVQCYKITDIAAPTLKNMGSIECIRLSYGMLSFKASQELVDAGIALIVNKSWWM